MTNNNPPSMLLLGCLGHQTCKKIIYKINYNMSSETSNLTRPTNPETLGT